MNNFVIVDIETTGLSALGDRIIEIGALKVKDGIVVDQFSELIDPERPVPARITEMTGITNEMVTGKRTIKEVLPDFLEFSEDLVLIGHNLMFDYSFLKQNAVNLSKVFERDGVDTLKIARTFLADLPSRRLDALCEHFGILDENHHRALNDVTVTWELYKILYHQFFNINNGAFQPFSLQYSAKKQSAATPRQVSYLTALLRLHNLSSEIAPEHMTKSEASRMIDQILSEYGR